MKTISICLAVAALVLCGCVIKTNRYSSTHNATTSMSGRQSPWGIHEQMIFAYTNHQGKAVLANERVVLVFDDISRDQQRAFHFQGNKQPVQVSGNGSSTVEVSCRRNLAFLRFHSAYVNGTNTIQFGKHVLQLAEAGHLLIAGEDIIHLSTNGQTCVHLTKGGAAVRDL